MAGIVTRSGYGNGEFFQTTMLQQSVSDMDFLVDGTMVDD